MKKQTNSQIITLLLFLFLSVNLRLNAQIITTVAGNGNVGNTGNGGQATLASLNSPVDVAVDAAGNLYIAEDGGIRKVTPAGVISDLVINVGAVASIAVSSSGEVYFAQIGIISKIDSNGIISTVVGGGGTFPTPAGIPIGAARISNPTCIRLDSNNNLYITDIYVDVFKVQGQFIYRVTGANEQKFLAIDANDDVYISDDIGIHKFIASTGGLYPVINGVTGPIAINPINGKLYVGDTRYQTSPPPFYESYSIIKKMDSNGNNISIVAGDGNIGFGGDGGLATLANIAGPGGIAITSCGMYFADTGNNRVRFVSFPQITFTNTSTIAQNGTLGTPYTLNAGATGTLALTYTVSPALPAGLSINPNTGVISGTPTATIPLATYTVTATQGGTCASSLSQDYTFAILCAPLNFTNTIAINGTIGIYYTLNASATSADTTTPISYSVNPSLPAGLSINPTTGVISGTPTTATPPTTYTVIATQGGCNATQNYIFSICSAVVLASGTTSAPTVGSPFTLNAGATGNTLPLTYSISPALPDGLFLNPNTGAISGTPTIITQETTYILTATQGGSACSTSVCSSSQRHTIKIICPTMNFRGITPPFNGTVGANYNSINTSVTGNTLPVMYTITPALPAGLFLHPTTGILSGVPTTVTTSNSYTVKARQGDCTVGRTFTFAIICPNITFASIIPPNGIVGTPYTLNAVATGTSTALVYTVNPSLPNGLSINPNTGLISGTPTSSAPPTIYTVTATQWCVCSRTRTYKFAITNSLKQDAPVPSSNAKEVKDKENEVKNKDNKENPSLDNVQIYPNPTDGIFNIDLGSIDLGKATANIYDMQGKTVLTSEIKDNKTAISLKNMPSGIYLIEINSTKQRIVKRIVKE